MDSLTSWVNLWLLAMTALAALMDARTGLIPNWLTLPTLAAAPLVHGFAHGPAVLGRALCGAGVCGLVPLILFGLRAIGGGDVKLFAAAGGLVGARLGLELQFVSYALCSVYALCLLAWRGALLATLQRSLALIAAPFMPKRRLGLLPAEALTRIRLGPAIFLASVLTVARAGLEL